MITISSKALWGLMACLLVSTIATGPVAAQSGGLGVAAGMPKAGANTGQGTESVPLPAAPVFQAPTRSEHAAPAPTGDALIKSMTGIVRSRDGKQNSIQVPANLRNILMGKQKSGAIKLQGTPGKLVQITKTTEYPYSTMGILANGCPGVLVSKHFVLTAAYCAYNAQEKKWFDNLDFFPGYNGKDAPFGSVKWKNVWAPEGYVNEDNLDFNFALVELADDISDKTGWMGFNHFPEFSMKQLNLTSYPYEGVPEFTMWQTTCKVSDVQDNYFFYQCPGKYQTVTAMGGGPVWFKGKGDNDWWVTGIHIGNVDDKKSHWAVRLNDANVQLLLSWMNPQDETTTTDDDDQDEATDDQDTDDQTTDCTCDDQTDQTDKTDTDETDDNSDEGGDDKVITVKPVNPDNNTSQ